MNGGEKDGKNKEKDGKKKKKDDEHWKETAMAIIKITSKIVS